MWSFLSIFVWFSAGLVASAGATEPASAPATATAPAVPQVRWHTEYKAAAAEARKRKALLVVVFLEPDSPACEVFEALTLKPASTRRFLASFAAVKLDVTSTEGRARFAKTGAEEAPLTRVFMPTGELLDSIPGCIIPAAAFRKRLAYSLACWKAVGTKPFNATARWKAIQARLHLSTRHKTAPAIGKLMKLPVRKLPEGATPARLHLARGKALLFTKPVESEKDLKRAVKLGVDDALAGGEAMLGLAHLANIDDRYEQAHEYCRRYIKAFPNGPRIGRAYFIKALLEGKALDDRAAAKETLSEFIRKYPDNPRVVVARQLLKMISAPVTTKPATSTKEAKR